jgi:hypothetical protein
MVEEKKILFIESSPTDMVAKMALSLKSSGYNSSLITITGDTNSPFLKKAYSSLLTLNFQFIKVSVKRTPQVIYFLMKQSKIILNCIRKIKQLRPDIIIVRTPPNWLYFLIKKYFRKVPSVYFPYDIRSFGYENFSELKKAGVPKFEIKAEAWDYTHADGIIHKGAEYEFDCLNKNLLGNISISSPVLHYLPYCLAKLNSPLNKNKLSKKDGEIHFVFAGHISKEKSWITSAKTVIDQKIHLHVYGKTTNVSKIDLKSNKDFEVLLKSPYFHVHDPVSQDKLAKELSKYDYGIWLGYYDINKYSISLCNGNKLASHMEAGIPTLYYKNHIAIGDLCKKYKAGIPIDIKTDFKKLLNEQDYKKFEKNILKSRQEYEFGVQVYRLAQFFEEVIKRKNKK